MSDPDDKDKQIADLREKLEEGRWKAADAERRLDDAHSELDLFEPPPPRKTPPDAGGAQGTLTVAGRLKRLRDLLAPDLVRGRHFASMSKDVGRSLAEMVHKGGRPYAVLVSDAAPEVPLGRGNIGVIMDLGPTTDDDVVAITVLSAASLARASARGMSPLGTADERERELTVAFLKDAIRLVEECDVGVSGYSRRRAIGEGEAGRG